MQLDCGNNIRFPSVVRVLQDSKQNGDSPLLPIIIGLVAGILLLLALILIVLKRLATFSKRYDYARHLLFIDKYDNVIRLRR